jgi:hypothetical protein
MGLKLLPPIQFGMSRIRSAGSLSRVRYRRRSWTLSRPSSVTASAVASASMA